MTLDTYTTLLFTAGLLAGVGISLTATTWPGTVPAFRAIYRYGHQHPTWGFGFLAIVIAAELTAAAIIFSAE